MVQMKKESKEFLEKYLPEVVSQRISVILKQLYDLIDEKGFAPPHYHEYNDFGVEAQKVYDDIYLSNAPEQTE